jgi:hypothetical protein
MANGHAARPGSDARRRFGCRRRNETEPFWRDHRYWRFARPLALRRDHFGTALATKASPRPKKTRALDSSGHSRKDILTDTKHFFSYPLSSGNDTLGGEIGRRSTPASDQQRHRSNASRHEACDVVAYWLGSRMCIQPILLLPRGELQCKRLY